MIEVVAAILVLAVGLMGVYAAIGTSNGAIAEGEVQATMAQVAQQQLQSVEALPYTNIADSSAPTRTTTTDTTNPTYYLASTCRSGACTYQPNPSDGSLTETVDVDTTNGKVAPGPATVVVPDPNASACSSTSTATCRITLSVYTFITETSDPDCSQTGYSCPSSSSYSYKRITVAVKNAGSGPPKDPVYVSSFVNQKVGGSANPLTSASTTCLDGTTSVSCTH
jgi:Tfp pilus assembly protein PilV